MTNTLSGANLLIKLEYDMVSQPHATTNVGPSLEILISIMSCSHLIIIFRSEDFLILITLQNLTIQPKAKEHV
jgi:hypothetical protein